MGSEGSWSLTACSAPTNSPTECVGRSVVRITIISPSPRRSLDHALGYYWGQFDPVRFGSPVWGAEQEAAWGGAVSQPVLYLHGTNDGCHGLDEEQVKEVPTHLGEGSESELIEGVGHFMLVEKPEEINARILGFLGKA